MTPEQLFEQNQKLVHFCAKQLRIPPTHYEDIIQEGMLELWRVANSFKPELGYAFATYAVPNIRGAMQRYCRDKLSIIKIPRPVWDGIEELDLQISSLEFELSDSDNSPTLGDLIPGEPDFYPNLFEADIEDFLATIKPGRYHDIAEEFLYGSAYGDKPTQVELAEKYGISQGQTSRLLTRARREFKDFLNSDE